MLKRFILLAIIILVSANSKSLATDFATYQEYYSAILNSSPNQSLVYKVENLFFEKEKGEFNLTDGYIIVGEPILGKTRFAYFVGKGDFTLNPDLEPENHQLYRYYNSRIFKSEIYSVFFACGDDFIKEITNGLQTMTPNNIEKIVQEYKDNLSSLKISKKESISPEITNTLINNKTNSMFFANIQLSNRSYVQFSIYPSEEEEVSFSKSTWNAPLGTTQELISMYPSTQRKSIKPDSNDYDDIKITKYEITAKIPNNTDMINVCTIRAKALKSGFSWMNFSLSYHFDIDSVIDGNGKKCVFYRDPSNIVHDFWIKSNKELSSQDTFSFTIYYDGNFISKKGDYYILPSSTGWYPKNSGRNKAIFDMTFYTNKDYKFICLGDKISSEVEGEFLKTRWFTPYPIRNASFQLGAFSVMKSKATDLLPINLYYITSNMREYILSDAENAFRAYSKIYGETPIKDFNMCEMLKNYGEAFPGLLHLATVAFEKAGTNGSFENFVSHETAHQWWGISVDFASYRDQWLSEAFAEYSAMMYVQASLEDKSKFFTLLKNYKKSLVKSSGLGAGMDFGAISLGWRNNIRTDNYQLVVYGKGAWTLHMLRNMMLDLKTMKEDAFYAMLKEYYNTYKGKNATTDNFIAIVEKYCRTDMKWFFNQWIHRTQIPKYTFGWKVEPTADGKYLIKMRVKQESVDSNFIMPIPLKVDFGDNRFYNFRINVTGKVAELTSAPMPLEPKNVEFNLFESVLCDWEKDDYEDIK